MKNRSRRSFFKTTAAIGAAVTGVTTTAKAGPKNILSPDRMGVLVDTTVCIGCRNCEWGCKTAHDLPAGDLETYHDPAPMEKMRRPDDTALTVINKYDDPEKPLVPTTVKVQCMHCDHPACVSACIVGAFTKEENGSVQWDTDMCIGCRYCMVACPFQIPAFEYHKAIHPNIMKCDFCKDRTKGGLLPACVDICPVEALTYGRREDLLRIAKERIRKNPDKYVNTIYGEHDAGGTAWLYLTARNAKELQFPDVGTDPMPGVSESIQHGIFAYFVPPVALYALLGSLMWITKNRQHSEEEGH